MVVLSSFGEAEDVGIWRFWRGRANICDQVRFDITVSYMHSIAEISRKFLGQGPCKQDPVLIGHRVAIVSSLLFKAIA